MTLTAVRCPRRVPRSSDRQVPSASRSFTGRAKEAETHHSSWVPPAAPVYRSQEGKRSASSMVRPQPFQQPFEQGALADLDGIEGGPRQRQGAALGRRHQPRLRPATICRNSAPYEDHAPEPLTHDHCTPCPLGFTPRAATPRCGANFGITLNRSTGNVEIVHLPLP